MEKSISAQKPDHQLQGKELARFTVDKTFRLYGMTKDGQEVYMGRHDTEYGRNDIIEIIVVEEIK